MTPSHVTYAAHSHQIDHLASVLIRRFAPLADSALREDLLQSARLAGFKAIASHDAGRGKPLSTWIYLRVQGAVIDGVRRQFASARLEPDADIESRQTVEDDHDSRILAMRVLAQVRRHEADTAELLMRYAVDGETMQAMATEAGISRSWMCREIGTLRRTLARRMA